MCSACEAVAAANCLSESLSTLLVHLVSVSLLTNGCLEWLFAQPHDVVLRESNLVKCTCLARVSLMSVAWLRLLVTC